MKSLVLLLLFSPFICAAQRSWKTGEALPRQVAIPTIGSYSFSSSKLIDWIQRNGGHASHLTTSIDFINVTYGPGNGIIGGAFGGVYSMDKTSSLNLYYGDIFGGVKLINNDWLQINVLAHALYVNYRIGDLIPYTFTQHFNTDFTHYTRGWTYGAGPSLQIRIKLLEFNDGNFISLGAEAGTIFMDPDAHWTFDYQYLTKNNNSSRYRYSLKTSRNTIDGPAVSSQLAYFRFSIVFNI